jgi:hypothetical protein
MSLGYKELTTVSPLRGNLVGCPIEKCVCLNKRRGGVENLLIEDVIFQMGKKIPTLKKKDFLFFGLELILFITHSKIYVCVVSR